MTHRLLSTVGAGLALAAGTVTTAQAADFNAIGTLTQAEFRLLAEDIGAAVSYKGMIPSEGLGITGFDLGVSIGATEVSNRAALIKAAGGADVPKAVPLAGLRAVKGLPFDIDIGAVVMSLPDTNVRAAGGELRWAFIGGNAALPAVALRASLMNLSGVDQLKMRATGVDLSISKGILFLTPYAGIGRVEIDTKAPGTTLTREKFQMDKVFAGVNIAFVPMALVIEADKTGDATSYGIKLAIRW
ncbi:MAG: hypothetical protein HZC37_15475 [Burkholderiales bacterium]|nr:hypothetical protein [Burkholderiales bacterium]